jgi:hypothetical protein
MIKTFTEILWKNKILQIIILELGVYFGLVTFLLYQIGFWNLSLLKDSILWFLLSGFVLYKDIITNRNWQDTMKSYLLNVVSISVIFEFITNIFCLPIWFLIIIIPIMCILQIVSSYSKDKEKYKNIFILSDNLITIIGFGILIYITYQLFDNFTILFQKDNLKAFILPIIYTITFLPFSLMNKIFAEYQQVYKRLTWRNDIKIPVNLKYIYRIYQFCKLDFEKLNKFLFFLTSSNYLNNTTNINDLIAEYEDRTTFLKFDCSCVGFEISKTLKIFSSINLNIEDYKDIEYDEGYGNYYGDKILKMNIRSFDNITYSATGTNQIIQQVELSYMKSRLTPKKLSEESEKLYLKLCKTLYYFCFHGDSLNKNLLIEEFKDIKSEYYITNKIMIYSDQITEYKFLICVKEPIHSNYYITEDKLS